MARSCICKSCGARIRTRAKDQLLGSAVRKHYWRHHREQMLAYRLEATQGED